MQVIEHLESCFITLLGSLNRLSFRGAYWFRVGQVTFSGRYFV